MVQEVDQKGVGRSRPLILAAFTKLRAICNHPVLAQGSHGSADVRFEDSGKLDSLKELMEEVVEGDHRTLLFSQSTQMLDIIQHFFKKWQINSIRLDGSTPPNTRTTLVGDFLEAISNPKHEEHSSMLEWIGGRFDSEEFDPKQATKEMKKGLPDWRSMR